MARTGLRQTAAQASGSGAGHGAQSGPSRSVLLILAGILVVGALLRGLYLVEASRAPDFDVPHVDSDYHNYWARGLAFSAWDNHGRNPDPHIRTTPFFRPPGYPYFLAFLYLLLGPGYLLPRVAQMLLGLTNVLLAFRLGKRMFDARVALVLAAMMATSWVLIFFEAQFLEPVLVITLILSLLLLLERWDERGGIFTIAAAGVLAGCLGLVRPNALLFVPLMVGWMVWKGLAGDRETHPRTPPAATRQGRVAASRNGLRGPSFLKPALLFCTLAALVILPASIRNVTVAHDPVLISSNGGINLFFGANPRAGGIVRGGTDLGEFDNCYDWPALVANLQKQEGRPVRDSDVSRHFSREATAYMLNHPGAVLGLYLRKILLFLGPLEPADDAEIDIERRGSAVLSWNPLVFPVILALAVPGIVLFYLDRGRRGGSDGQARARGTPDGQVGSASDGRDRGRSGDSFSALVPLVGLVWFLSFVPFAVNARYRAPLVPFLMLFGSFFAVRMVRHLRAGEARRAVRWLVPAVGVGALASVNWAGYKPSPARWHYERAIAYTAKGDNGRALPEYEAAVAANPEYTKAVQDLGAALASAGQVREAVPLFRRVIQKDPGSATAHYNLGAALEMLQDLPGSLAEYEAALRCRPDHAGARAGIDRVRAKLQGGVRRAPGT